MLNNHPKGVYVAFAINVGERFGFYIMIAILSLFLQAKYGLSVAHTGDYYSWFYFSVYATALFGGFAADWMRQYKSVVLTGQIMMIVGYVAIAMPFMPFYGSLIALLIIALGNGLFKGNLQVVVSQLYDDERYAKLRDSAFLFFYTGVNIGAFAAPFIASGIRNWWLNQHGFLYDGSLPSLCHQLLNNTLRDTSVLQDLAQKVTINPESFTGINEFASRYIQVFSQGYNCAFAIAALALISSLLINIIFNRNLPDKSSERITRKSKESLRIKQPMKQRKVTWTTLSLIIFTIALFQLIPGIDTGSKLGLSLAIGLFMAFIAYIYLMAADEERPKVIPLIFLYIITIVFWMSFNQNGLILTQFAVDYTAKHVGAVSYLFFDFKSILCLLLVIAGIVLMFREKSTLRYRFIGGGIALIFGAVCYYFVKTAPPENPVSPEVFQAFNPLFVLLLMPLIIWFFSFLNTRGHEPSAPRKIGIGLIIAGLAFIILVVASIGVASPRMLNGDILSDDSRVSPYWLMSTYLMLTVAEVFLSPMGMSFISKVSPKRFHGLMQGGWLFTTAVGNKFLFLGSYLWGKMDLYLLWALFAACCMGSAVVIFIIIKRLEKATFEK